MVIKFIERIIGGAKVKEVDEVLYEILLKKKACKFVVGQLIDFACKYFTEKEILDMLSNIRNRRCPKCYKEAIADMNLQTFLEYPNRDPMSETKPIPGRFIEKKIIPSVEDGTDAVPIEADQGNIRGSIQIPNLDGTTSPKEELSETSDQTSESSSIQSEGKTETTSTSREVPENVNTNSLETIEQIRKLYEILPSNTSKEIYDAIDGISSRLISLETTMSNLQVPDYDERLSSIEGVMKQITERGLTEKVETEMLKLSNSNQKMLKNLNNGFLRVINIIDKDPSKSNQKLKDEIGTFVVPKKSFRAGYLF